LSLRTCFLTVPEPEAFRAQRRSRFFPLFFLLFFPFFSLLSGSRVQGGQGVQAGPINRLRSLYNRKNRATAPPFSLFFFLFFFFPPFPPWGDGCPPAGSGHRHRASRVGRGSAVNNDSFLSPLFPPFFFFLREGGEIHTDFHCFNSNASFFPPFPFSSRPGPGRWDTTSAPGK